MATPCRPPAGAWRLHACPRNIVFAITGCVSTGHLPPDDKGGGGSAGRSAWQTCWTVGVSPVRHRGRTRVPPSLCQMSATLGDSAVLSLSPRALIVRPTAVSHVPRRTRMLARRWKVNDTT